MRVSDIVDVKLLERRNPVMTMYHGTTDKFLPSIRRDGLLPESGNKSFHTDEFDQSFGGIYLTNSLELADLAGIAAARRHGGHSIIVQVQYVQTSGVLDEDRYQLDLINEIQDRYPEPITRDLVQSVFSSVFGRIGVTNNLKLIELIYYYMRLAYEFIEDYEVDDPFDIETESFMANGQLRKLSVAISDAVRAPSNSLSVRVRHAIGYRGRTRIVRIFDPVTQEDV